MAKNQKTSGSGGGDGDGGGSRRKARSVRSKKKREEKKAPLRGLSIARLEKIRLEEEDRKQPQQRRGMVFSPPCHCSSCGFWPKNHGFGYDEPNMNPILTSPFPFCLNGLPTSHQFRHQHFASCSSSSHSMVGMKKPCPFLVETPPAPALLSQFAPSTGYTDPGFCLIRGSPSRSSTLSEKNVIPECGVLNGDFLTLGPPRADDASSPQLSSTHSVLNSGSLSPLRLQLGFQAPSKSMQAAKEEIGQIGSSSSNRNAQDGQVDLTLKL